MAKKGIQLNQELARKDRPYDATRRQSVAWAETLAMEQNAILFYPGGPGRDFAAPPDSHAQMRFADICCARPGGPKSLESHFQSMREPNAYMDMYFVYVAAKKVKKSIF